MLLHLYLVLKGGAPPATEKQMYTGKGTRDTRVACGDVSSWATPGLPKEWSCMGVIPKGCTTTLEITGIRGVQTAAGSEPCSLPRPALLEPSLGQVQTHGVAQTLLQPALESRHHRFPAGMLCRDKEPLES